MDKISRHWAVEHMLRIVFIASAFLFAFGSPTQTDAGALLGLGAGTSVGAGAAAARIIGGGLLRRGAAGAVRRGSSTQGLTGSVSRGVGRYGLDDFDDDGWSEGLHQGHQEMSDALRRGRDSIRFDQAPPLNFNSNIRF
jgi:hypothetical protein